MAQKARFLTSPSMNQLSPEIVAISSSLSTKSNTAALSAECVREVGITAAPCCNAQRSSTCVGVRWRFAAMTATCGSSLGEMAPELWSGQPCRDRPFF